MTGDYHSIDIIGGGIIGTTLATELLREIRKRGLRTEVHLFERQGQLGIENTEKSFEGVRTYWFTGEELRFYLTSLRAFADLKAHLGDDARFDREDPNRVEITARYRPVGYHYFLSEDEFAAAQRLEPIFRGAGVPIEFHSKQEARRIDWIKNNFDLDALILDEDAWTDAHFDLDGWRKARFDLSAIFKGSDCRHYEIAGYVRVPVAGFISAGDVVASYRAVFEKLRGRLHLNTEVLGVDASGKRIDKIRYRRLDEVSAEVVTKPTDCVVNAAGAWSDELNAVILGERLGIVPHRRYPLIVDPPKGYATDHGMVLLKQRVIRPDGDRIWLYFTPPKEKPGIEEVQPDDRVFDAYFFEYIYPVFCHPERPFIRDADAIGLYGSTAKRGWLGHYADTSDERPLIGIPRPEKLENYAVSTGYSGHGVQASVASALGLAHRILRIEDEPVVDIPDIYDASRDLAGVQPDHSRL